MNDYKCPVCPQWEKSSQALDRHFTQSHPEALSSEDGLAGDKGTLPNRPLEDKIEQILDTIECEVTEHPCHCCGSYGGVDYKTVGKPKATAAIKALVLEECEAFAERAKECISGSLINNRGENNAFVVNNMALKGALKDIDDTLTSMKGNL